MLKKIRSYIRNRKLYITADPADNSITLSPALFNLIKQSAASDHTQAKVFVFFIPQTQAYAFMLNPPISQPTQLCCIQTNAKHNCIGFESLCPSVNRILYDYNLPPDIPHRLKVTTHTDTNNLTYYQIERNNA